MSQILLILTRTEFSDTSTIGSLSLDGKHLCWILEDKVRSEKIAGITAIPYGKYKVVITQSARFKRLLPLLLNVPGYSGIRIHPGNKAVDTDGCLLPGTKKQSNMVLNSKIAFSTVFKIIQTALSQNKEVWIEIKEGLQKNYV